MAATVKYDTYTSASYSWDSASAGQPCKDVVDELKSWVTTINGNASQTSRQVVVLRDETDSTTTNYRGWAVELPQDGSNTLYSSLYTSSATNIRFYSGTGFTDDTSNGGYGTVTPVLKSDTSITWASTAAVDVYFSLAYSTVDGEEYFFVGWDLGSDGSVSDFWGIFKTTEGYWAVLASDGTSTAIGGSFGGAVTEDSITLDARIAAGTSNILGPGSPFFYDTVQASTTDVHGVVAKSADMYSLGAKPLGNYVSFADGSIAAVISQACPIAFRTPVS